VTADRELLEARRGFERILKRLGNGRSPHPQDIRWARAIAEERIAAIDAAVDAKLEVKS